MAGRRAAQEHGQRARARAAVEEPETGEGEGNEPQETRTQAEIDRDAANERERAVMEGGPGEGERAREEPSWQAFKYGDREFRTQEELTSYIDGLQAQRQEPVRQQPAQPAQQVQQPQERRQPGSGIDFEKDLYIDPKKVFSQFGDEIRAEIRQELTQQYNADQTMRKFWDDFNSKNEDLRGKDLVVQAVFNRDLKEIGDLPIPKAIDALADRVRNEIVSLTGKRPARDGENSARQRTLVEAGNGPAPRGGAERQSQERVIPSTLSGIIRERQKARQASRQS